MKEIVKKILNVINVHPDDNQKWLLLSWFFAGLLATYASPAITKAVVSTLPAEWIAFQAVFSSVVSLVLGMIWKNNFRRNIIHYFTIFCITECTIGFLMAMYLVFVDMNIWVLAITELIYGNFVCTLVAKCVMAFKAKLWQDSEREIYDNNFSIISGITCIGGFGFALIAMPSLSTAMFVWGLCCIIDDLGWIIVYNKNKKLLQEII